MTRPLLSFAITAALIFSPGCSDQKSKWRAEGRAEAERDMADGKLRLKTYGLPAPWAWKYRDLAREKLGVEFDTVAGCVVDDKLVERAEGYNEKMAQEIDRRHGPGALDKLAEEVSAEYQKAQEGEGAAKP